MKITVITQHCFVIAKWCLHRVKDPSVSHTAHPGSRLELHKKLGGDRDRTAGPELKRGIPCHMASFSAIKTGGKGDMFIVMTFVFPRNHYMC